VILPAAIDGEPGRMKLRGLLEMSRFVASRGRWSLPLTIAVVR